MRLLGVLALVAPAAVGILFLTNPGLTASWVADGSRSVVTAVTAVAIGVAMASAIAWTIVWIRYGRLVKAAERIAAGDYTVAVPTSGGGMESRSGQGHQRDLGLARRHDRPGDDRPPDRRGQSPGPPRGPVRRGRARVALRAPAVRRLRRHRPFQGGQRLVRPRVGRHRPAGRRPDHRREPSGERPHRPLRRRGVHADPDRDRRRGRRSSEREAAQARRAAAVQRRGQQRPLGHDLDRHRRRVGPEAPDGQPRPGRRCRDVFGQVARAQPDLHLRGARRGRPRPASPDLRRRAHPRHGDRPAGARRPPRTC